jgi:ubiquinone/menaquinone biosynthesis C-methylase UbiE
MNSGKKNADAFRSFEHAGWEKLPQRYHEAFSNLTTQAIEPLLNAAAVGAGVRFLDVATGPGYVAGAAARRGASALGLDFSAAMVAEARKRFPAAEFQEGDAEELPFAEASFDAIAMNFGLLHLGRPESALANACRVLRPAGKAGFTVWAKPDQAVGFGITLRAIQKHGDMNAPLPSGPPFFRFSDAEEFRRALVAAGFMRPAIVALPQTWRLASGDELFEIMLGSTVRTGGLLRAQAPAALEAIRAEILESASAYRKSDGIELPMPAVLASATKP